MNRLWKYFEKIAVVIEVTMGKRIAVENLYVLFVDISKFTKPVLKHRIIHKCWYTLAKILVLSNDLVTIY